jgi:ATP-binding cassette subfamily B protein
MYITRLYAVWSGSLNKKIQSDLGDANGVATEAIVNIRTVKSFSTEALEIARHEKFTRSALRRGILDALAQVGTSTLGNYLDLGANVIILWYGGSIVLSGTDASMTAGDLVTFQLYWNKINGSFNQFSGTLAGFTRASGAAERVLGLMDRLPSSRPTASMGPAAEGRGQLELQSVEFSYPTRRSEKVLNGLSVVIPGGTIFAFVGHSGSGKSTVMQLLMRLYEPTSGGIFLDGMNLSDIDPSQLHQMMAIVAQDSQLFGTTIEENIAYGIETYTHEQVEEAARRANAHEFISSFKSGYDTRIG